ncbi:3-hydroxyisobutyrate dehydrogenase [Opisthorchis viverrini]|uniref:3-hydroxyisobutyrate dehydrogenase n=1 Tax=Opisthorchis viverrini TaxID=6198 RepID=A0A1S8WLS2_OPIVI|nr:3-hydroxyisobutyrate dehydrogenase [Opisthorchis viverrini]
MFGANATVNPPGGNAYYQWKLLPIKVLNEMSGYRIFLEQNKDTTEMYREVKQPRLAILGRSVCSTCSVIYKDIWVNEISHFKTWSHILTTSADALFDREDSTDKTVGFIGLGQMGSRMALNLAKAGYNIHVYDIANTQTNEFRKQATPDLASRITTRASLEELMTPNAPQTIITMLPSSPHVTQTYGSEAVLGMVALAKPGTSFIDCTTGDPHVAKEVAKYVWTKQCSYIDAPVSGGVPSAEQATLTFMVGGSEEACSRAKPFLECMGKRIFHCGPVGAGLAAKICNNMLLAISMVGVSEAMELGRRLGLRPEMLTEVINASSGRCWSSEVYNPVPGVLPNSPASRGYSGGFSTRLMTKDLGLAQSASTATQCPTPLGSLAHQIYQNMCQYGFADQDFSVVYRYLSKSL